MPWRILWPAHRPLQYSQIVSVDQGSPSYSWRNWSSGVQQTNQGDLKMVTEWANLPFIIRNPYLGVVELNSAPSDLSGGPRYVSVEPFRGS